MDIIHRVIAEGFYICYTEEEKLPLEQRLQRVRDTAEGYMMDKDEVERIHQEVRKKLKLV